MPQTWTISRWNTRQLLNLKDAAHYGFISITAPELKRALRQAGQLVEFAESVTRRGGAGVLAPERDR